MKKDALDFLKAVKQDPMAMKTLKEISGSYINQNMAPILSDVAKKLNYDISSEDISEALKQEDAAVKSATDKNVESILEVDDDELSEVAGGEDLYTRGCTARHLRLKSEGCIDTSTFLTVVCPPETFNIFSSLTISFIMNSSITFIYDYKRGYPAIDIVTTLVHSVCVTIETLFRKTLFLRLYGQMLLINQISIKTNLFLAGTGKIK